MNRGQGRNTIVPTDRHVSGTNLIYDMYFQIYMYILYKALLISKYVADVFSKLRQRRFLAFEETPLSKLVAILEADPNDDEFSGVKSTAD